MEKEKLKYQKNAILIPQSWMSDFTATEKDKFELQLPCSSCNRRMSLKDIDHIAFRKGFHSGEGEWFECNLCGKKNFLTKRTILDIIRGI